MDDESNPARRAAPRRPGRARRAWQAAGWAALAGLAVLLAGCESTPTVPAPVETRTAAGPGTEGAAGAGPGGADAGGVMPQSRVAGVALGGSAGGAGGSGTGPAGAAKVVYFDYDSFAIKSEYQGLLEAEAKALAARPAGRLVIEGHTDERGGSEYNLALGQKRAEAVLRVLVLLGAPAQRMEAVSFGKERPAVDGHDEAAWAKNRRAELKDE